MNLKDRLKFNDKPCEELQEQKSKDIDRESYYSIKNEVHTHLVEKFNLSDFNGLPQDIAAEKIRSSLEEITENGKILLNREERTRLIRELIDEILGLGPIEPYMHDDSIQDILVNGCDKVFIEKDGILHNTLVRFRDNDHLMQVIDKIVSRVGRRIDESSPMVDARLPDGSRINVIIPPIALDGPILSIRKFSHHRLDIYEFLNNLTLTEQMIEYLRIAIKSKLNILISGGTGSGKTTLLNILSGFIPRTERIVTIEDSAELNLHQPHVVRLESRPPNIEFKGEITLTDLVKNSLRMRPDRIIVGETRGAEVLDMLQAMNTGHPGSMSTVHANSPQDAFARIEVMIGMAPTILSEQVARGLIASAIDIMVHLTRLPDGRRRVMSISEVVDAGVDKIGAENIFVFDQEGVGDDGRVYGRFESTGAKSVFMEHMRKHGFELQPEIFDFRHDIR